MSDKETQIIIGERIKKIDEAIAELKKLQKFSKKEFLKDKTIQYAAMYGMILGIEAICDIGNHILANFFNRPADTYKDIILSLGECEIIPQSFAKKSSQMTDFRNILIHLYLKIDSQEVYKNFKKAPLEFNKFVKYFLKFLK